MALKTKVLLATTMLGSLAAFAPTVTLAQTAAPAGQEATSVEEVVVTGSRIRRDPTNAPTPLIQVTRDEVVSTGQASVIDVLADIPALSGSTVPEDTTGSGLNDGGLSLLNLRDLGTARTLTLVDGRRHVGASSGGLAVDVDTIPRLLIQNVELITGSNSAQYGADAVSGVVNFVLRKDFQGLEVDGTAAQINQDGQLNKRLSVLAGHNFFDGRLNVYGSAEYEHNDEVRDSQMDWRKKAWVLLNNDTDVANSQPDGVMDNILIHDARTLSIGPVGGITVLANSLRPSANPGDPDIPFQSCTTATAPMSANCFAIEPGNSFIFDQAGAARNPSFGTFRDENGFQRVTNIGGDGLNPNTDFSQGSRLPSSKNYRFQGGLNFNITEDLQLFGEAKYVKEDTFDEGQATFFDIGILPVAAGANPIWISNSSFNVGLDNAYLPANVRTAIQNNIRTPITAYNATTGDITTTAAINDVRARHSLFGPTRSQLNKKELERYVVGFRGSKDDVSFVHNLAYELGYTYGKLKNQNFERGNDAVRYKFGADAVVDTAGIVNGKAGEVVCRVKLLDAQGATIKDDARSARDSKTVNYVKGTKQYEEISACQPFRIFGAGGITPAAAKYMIAEINLKEQNVQQDALGYVSGELWDFWGAGRIGLAAGYEWRREETQGIGRSASTGDRFLFMNTGPDFLPASYETKEYFGEFRLPLLRDVPFAKNLEIGAAYRHSDYTTIGVTETYNFNMIWRPIQDIMFRATSGKSVRAPTLRENFGPPTQTFATITDPCDATQLRNQTNATIKANREKNCAALGIPTGTNILYASTPSGKNAGNPFLKPEKSFSVTGSMVITPRFWPKATFVVDYYDIDIKDVISAITAQTAANQCVSGNALDANICSTLTRIGGATQGTTPAYGIIDFIQGSVNYARTTNRGIDYQFLYHTDVQDIIGKDWGRLDYRLSGNYLFEQHDFVNISDTSLHNDNESGIGYPRVRFSSKLTWEVNDKLTVAWNVDWQAAQWIFNGAIPYDADDIKADPDNRDPRYYKSTPFTQHDFTVKYAVRPDLVMRAGVVNAFDEEPSRWLGNTTADNFDFFGRRFFLGFNYKM
jgi:outer membrane receptor protein involved in Fe transport